MNGGGIASFFQNLATFLLGPFGKSAIIMAVAMSFLGSAFHVVPRSWGWISLIFGALAFSAAYFVNTFIV